MFNISSVQIKPRTLAMKKNPYFFILFSVPDDLTPEEQKELENIRRRKQELLDDIQVIMNCCESFIQLELTIQKSATLCYITTHAWIWLAYSFNNLQFRAPDYNQMVAFC